MIYLGLASLLSPLPLTAQTTAQAALTSALRGTPAVGVVWMLKTGRPVGCGEGDRSGAPYAPGSILKPLFLAAALEQHEVLPETTVFCRRNLHISDGGQEWNLACTHPQSDVAFAAKEALAYSCNRYFAELGRPNSTRSDHGHPGTLRSGAGAHSADPGAERAAGVGRGGNLRLPAANGSCLSQVGAGTRRQAERHRQCARA